MPPRIPESSSPAALNTTWLPLLLVATTLGPLTITALNSRVSGSHDEASPVVNFSVLGRFDSVMTMAFLEAF